MVWSFQPFELIGIYVYVRTLVRGVTTYIHRIGLVGPHAPRPLLGDLRPCISQHRTWGASAELLQRTRASLRRVTMFGYFAAGLPGKLVLLCMSDGKLRKSERWQQVCIRPHILSTKIFPKFTLNKTESSRNCEEILSYCPGLNSVAESGIMPEGSCCNYPAPANINAWVLRTKYYHISLHSMQKPGHILHRRT